MKKLKIICFEVWKIFELAYPISISNLSSILMGIIDNIMIGRVGYEYLAASSLANGIYYLIVIFGTGLSYAVAPLVSILNGANKTNKTEELLHSANFLAIIISIILTIAIYFGSDLIYFLGQEKKIEIEAIKYLKILSLGTPFFVLFMIQKQFVDGFHFTLPGMSISIIANAANVFLNYLLIYGKFGFPELKLEGAGWATNISRLIMLAMIMIYLSFYFNKIRVNYLSFVKSIKKEFFRKVLRLGVGSSFQYFFEMGAFTFAGIMIGWLGARQLSAHQIALNLATLTYMIVLGISSAGSIRIAKYYSSKKIYRARKAGLSALLLAICFMFLSCLAFIIFRSDIPKLYVDDNETIIIASKLFIIAGLFQIFDGAQATGLGLLRGMNDVKYPTLTTFFSYWIISLSASYFFGFILRYDVIGVWIGFLLGLIFSAASLNSRFLFLTKINKL